MLELAVAHAVVGTLCGFIF